MSARDTVTCEDCYLPLSICICNLPDPVDYDPVARREELLGRLEDLGTRIERALSEGTVKTFNPFSDGDGNAIKPDVDPTPVNKP